MELPALLGVDLIHCESAAARAVAERPSLLNVQGELITQKHLDGLASEANQLLQVKLTNPPPKVLSAENI